MDVKTRNVCSECGGTGRNNIRRTDALKQIQGIPAGGVLMQGQFAPPSTEERIEMIQSCVSCNNGYQERWVPLNELLSMGL